MVMKLYENLNFDIYIIYYYILERYCGKIIFVKEILIFKIESIYFEYFKF